jgi:hypothetical protein
MVDTYFAESEQGLEEKKDWVEDIAMPLFIWILRQSK